MMITVEVTMLLPCMQLKVHYHVHNSMQLALNPQAMVNITVTKL